MHLKSLTLKGFKSFAQATTFAFESGVTCIVGPNGSGKSNVVDALAWVMGEQGAKNLRGGSMADVIFAGTATRGPLGRAEVTLTIDNADGALPIEYTEVAISRILFRDGRSEYAVNGRGVRLLDVQELLSDSGLGREMHVIVGQGQLDAVLRASPTERRGFIEEAAGILKHRRRKERTVRKLDAMQANLTRLTDLADELRRQLKPLGAQARIAQEAAGIQAEVREARTRLLAVDAAALAGDLARLREQQARLADARQVAEDIEQSLERRTAALESAAADDELDALRRTALDLRTAQERLRSLAQAAATKRALLAPEPAGRVAAGPSADELAAARSAVAVLEARVGAAGPGVAHAAQALAAAQRALQRVDESIAAQARRVADHDRERARLRARAGTADERLGAARADLGRRRAALDAAEARATAAGEALDAAPAVGAAGPADLGGLEERDAAAAAAHEKTRTALHDLERRWSGAQARLAALRAATATPPAVADVLRALPGARRIQDVLEVDEPQRAAIGAALGALADAALLPPGADPLAAAAAAGSFGAVDLIRPDAAGDGPAGVRGPAPALALLADVVLVDDLPAALAAATGRTVAVTAAGEVVTARRLRTAGAAAAGIALAGERDDAERAESALAGEVAVARQESQARQADRSAAAAALAAGRAAAREHEQAARRADRDRAGLVARAEAAGAERDRAAQQARDATASAEAAAAAAEEAGAALRTHDAGERPALDASLHPPALQAVEDAREAGLAARLETETAAARLRGERDRLSGLERQAAEAERAAEAAARREAERSVQRETADEVVAVLPPWLAAADASAAEAAVRVADAERRRAERGGALKEARDRLTTARAEVIDLDRRGRDVDMRAYETEVSLGAIRDRAATELGLDAEALSAEAVEGVDRRAEERRLAAAERRLGLLGRVNPLALEEFTALEQRHAFLAEQLADLTRTRADLLTIVADLDTRMAETFDAAYADTEAAFARIFPVLFPGGAGRLSRVAAEDGDGVEVAVRPAGKKIERLSLLSGGERSLAAVAFLLAIFTARPSPFYILDEVEAALDDANLGRLLQVISSLRDESQLILITHQKRTMEIADALYGVSMRQDGVSNVIGQRLTVVS